MRLRKKYKFFNKIPTNDKYLNDYVENVNSFANNKCTKDYVKNMNSFVKSPQMINVLMH